MKNDDTRPPAAQGPREIIDTNNVIKKGEVKSYTEHVKVYGAIGISVFAMIIAVSCLWLGVESDRENIITWSTTLMSGIVGSALTYAFTKKGE
jgi:hypothetical protein